MILIIYNTNIVVIINIYIYFLQVTIMNLYYIKYISYFMNILYKLDNQL